MTTKKATTTYEKPEIKKQEKMEFPLRGVKSLGSGIACRQCSSCHNCK